MQIKSQKIFCFSKGNESVKAFLLFEFTALFYSLPILTAIQYPPEHLSN